MCAGPCFYNITQAAPRLLLHTKAIPPHPRLLLPAAIRLVTVAVASVAVFLAARLLAILLARWAHTVVAMVTLLEVPALLRSL